MNIRKVLFTTFVMSLFMSSSSFAMAPHQELSLEAAIANAKKIVTNLDINDSHLTEVLEQKLLEKAAENDTLMLHEDAAKYIISISLASAVNNGDILQFQNGDILQFQIETTFEENATRQEQLKSDETFALLAELFMSVSKDLQRNQQEKRDEEFARSLQQENYTSPNFFEKKTNNKPDHQLNNFSIEEQLLQAAKDHDFERVKQIVESGSLQDLDIGESLTPLHHATMNGNLKIVQYLINNGALVEFTDKEGNTALFAAVMHNRIDIAKYLIEDCKAKINVKNTSRGFTPLHYACKYNFKELAQYLIDNGADIHAKDNEEHEPLYHAKEGSEISCSLLKKQKELLKDPECMICFERTAEEKRSFLPCAHWVCETCKSQLPKQECPSCRISLNQDQIIN